MNTFKLIAFLCILFVIHVQAQEEYPYPTTTSSPAQYRPDSSSCKRFHEAISKSVVECVTKNVLFINMYCRYTCYGSGLRLSDCHRHSTTQLDYPYCNDIFCRDANEVTTCNELPFLGHPASDFNGHEYGHIMPPNRSSIENA